MTKVETASWLGYGSDPDAVARMDADHDELHRTLCAWLGVQSYALREAAGQPLDRREHDLAAYEEDAVLYLTRFLTHAGLSPLPRK